MEQELRSRLDFQENALNGGHFNKHHSKALLKKNCITYVFQIFFMIFSKHLFSRTFLNVRVLKSDRTFYLVKNVQHSIYFDI